MDADTVGHDIGRGDGGILRVRGRCALILLAGCRFGRFVRGGAVHPSISKLTYLSGRRAGGTRHTIKTL